MASNYFEGDGDFPADICRIFIGCLYAVHEHLQDVEFFTRVSGLRVNHYYYVIC